MLVRIGPEIQEVPRPLTPHLVRVSLGVVAVAVVAAGYTTFRIWDQGGRDERRPAGAIVVLGAAQYNGVPSPLYRSRLEHAIGLLDEGHAPLLVVTGGKREGDRTTEAAAGRSFAVAEGVDESRILAEDRGRNTLESMQAVGPLLRERGIRDAIFVSDPSHMLRVLLMARDEGIVGWGSPSGPPPNAVSAADRIGATAYELAALAVYFIAGRSGPGGS